MQIIPVLDLLRGHAVHARRGARSRYQPLESVLLPGRAGDAVTLSRAYRETLQAELCYVADLDAIQGWPAQHDLIRRLAHPVSGFGKGLLVDAGIATPAAAKAALDAGASAVVVGLETMRTFADLKRVVAAVGGTRVLFSLDMMDGIPIRRRTGKLAREEAVGLELAARAAETGVAGIIVLDLAAVGAESGPRNLGLMAGIKRLLGIPLFAGGGVRSRADLDELAQVGCDGALVGTAIHAGLIP
jgi:phosphoribosylformimino-5-aminoimidazole carboxamide ribotide isomerase